MLEPEKGIVYSVFSILSDVYLIYVNISNGNNQCVLHKIIARDERGQDFSLPGLICNYWNQCIFHSRNNQKVKPTNNC